MKIMNPKMEGFLCSPITEQRGMISHRSTWTGTHDRLKNSHSNCISSSMFCSTRGFSTQTALAPTKQVHKKQQHMDKELLDAYSSMDANSLEGRLEKVIYSCRFMAFLGIIGSLMGSIICFLKGCVYVANSFEEQFLHGGGKVISMLVESIDIYLIGTVMLVFGMGLYELFISNMDIAQSSSYGSDLLGLFRLPARPKWLEIKSVNELKTKLGHVIVMVLLIGLFEKSKKTVIQSSTDLFCFAASILLSSISLFLLSKLQTHSSKESHVSSTT
ncbi:hypothetical protein LUZ60_007288 [Juncus effusus]|nr:hypothetical protein LUZ60_007288 [Juncus effusus]